MCSTSALTAPSTKTQMTNTYWYHEQAAAHATQTQQFGMAFVMILVLLLFVFFHTPPITLYTLLFSHTPPMPMHCNGFFMSPLMFMQPIRRGLAVESPSVAWLAFVDLSLTITCRANPNIFKCIKYIQTLVWRSTDAWYKTIGSKPKIIKNTTPRKSNLVS